MKDEHVPNPNLTWALQSYVMDSGRLLLVELDDQGRIGTANLAFRSRFAGFSRVHGKPLACFQRHESGDHLGIEPGLAYRTPVAHVLKGVLGGEAYLFHAYPIDQGTLLIGELANVVESDIVERMGHLAMEMSRLVRDLRKTNHKLALANELNQSLARTDPLTELANRRYFMERLNTSIAHALARDHRLSLLMIDLDHFKRVNDRFGHAGGDAMLVAFARLLKSQVRAADLPGRFGGEEFVLYMLDADLRAATEAAERLRTQLAGLRLLDADFCVTASVGVTELSAGETAETLLIRADDLLYRAKTEGRNRVIAEACGT